MNLSQSAGPAPSRVPPVNVVVLTGPVSGVEVVALASGTRLARASLRTVADGRTTSVPLVWFDPPAWFDTLDDETVIMCVGAVQRRFFQRPGGLGARVDVVVTHAGRTSRRRELAAVERRLRSVWADAVA